MFNLLFDSEKICLFCLDNMQSLDGYICPECRSNIEKDHRIINTNLIYMDACYYSAYYNRFIKTILHDFKFNDKSYLYKPLGEFLVTTIKKYSLDKQIDMIYYVPLHRRKKAKRGFNQSELLASYISKKLELPISHNLKKIKSTKDQHRLNRLERQTNLYNSFKLKNVEEVRDRSILLIDDLITTGATLDECSKLFKENQAKKVTGLCLSSVRK